MTFECVMGGKGASCFFTLKDFTDVSSLIGRLCHWASSSAGETVGIEGRVFSQDSLTHTRHKTYMLS